MSERLRVGISGASGLIGGAVTSALEQNGHVPVPIVRRSPSSGEIGWDPAAGHIDPSDLRTLDAVVNLSGAGIGDHRWTDAYRDEIRTSRTSTTALFATTFAELGADAPRVLVNASAIGFYGDRGDERLTEESSAGTGFLPDVCRDWEAATAPAEAAARVATVRTGIVLSTDGGALAKMAPLFRLGLGGRFGNGRQWMSWITLRDEARAIVHVIESDLSGPINLTAPSPVVNREFASTLGTVLRRPTVIPVPEFGPKLLLGGELAQALLFDSARVLPTVLETDGFEFEHRELEPALRSLFRRDAD